MPKIFMAGIDHHSAPLEVRERFSFTTSEKNSLMESVAADPAFDGCILLSTCNRTELWVTGPAAPVGGLHSILCRFKGLDEDVFASYFTEKSGEDAISYLFDVTSGLKSRIIGEDQILAQVKRALDDAREAGCCGSILEVLFRSAVTGAKKVKTDLSISTANASAVDFAIGRMAEQGFDFTDKKCLVIGNGEMGKRAATALMARGAQVTVTIRQYRSGVVEVVPGCRRIDYADRFTVLPECAIVVSATSSPNYTITREQLSQCALPQELMLIDLAVPRDIAPDVAELPGVTLRDIDAFSVTQTEELKCQLAQAEVLLEQQKQKFLNWLGCRDLLPTLDTIGVAFAEDLLFRMGQTLKELPPQHRQAVEAALTQSADKVLKKALFAVRDADGTEVFRQCVTAMDAAWK